MNNLSVFGASGFIGSHWMNKNPENFAENRDSIKAQNNKILYFRGTTTNYNVFNDLQLDVNTNLNLFLETLKNTGPDLEFNLVSSWFVHFPKGFYSATKLCQEQLLESYCKTFGKKYRILRLCNVLGGDKKKSAQKNALEYIIDKLKKNERIDVYEGDNYRNYLHVSDVCNAIKLILENGELNTIYEIGDTKSYKLLDIINFCRDYLKSSSLIKIVETPKFHQIVQIKDFHMDSSKLYELGYKKQYNIEETLIQLCK